jgi:HlyD family secretion protein
MAKKKSKTRLYIILGVVLLIIISTVLIAIFNKNDDDILVTTSKVERKTIVQTVSAVGKIEPETEVKISSEASGEIIYLGIKEGDTVKSGTPLIRIKPDIIETQLEQFRSAADASKIEIEVTKSEMKRAESDLKRISELFSKEFSSKQEFDFAKSTYDKAVSAYNASLSRYQQSLSALKQIQRSADRTTIYSPISGIVTKLLIEKGEKVVGTAQFEGTKLMTISDLAVMNAIVEVDENDIVMVKVGDTAKIEVDALRNVFFKGVVVEIGHSAIVNQVGTADQVTNFSVKIRFIDLDSKLRPGMSCNVEIETDKKENVLAVPLTSVTVRDNKKEEESTERIQKKEEDKDKKNVKRPPSVVFKKSGMKAKMLKVKTGISDRGFIEIIEGLSEGEEIISGNFMAVSKLLKDGTKIRVDNQAKKKSK